MDTPGTGTYTYTVTAVLGNWTTASGASGAVTVSAAPTKLAFTTQPASGASIQAKGTGSFSVSVAVEDSTGNTITSDTRNVTLAINTNPSSGVLSCTNAGGLTVPATAGVATFTGCAITKVGTGYTLTATSSPALTAPANANSFNITAGSPAALSLTPAATNPKAGAANGLIITALDQNGNTATSYTGTKSLTFTGASPIGTFNPSVTNNGSVTPVAVAFGTAENINFSSGVATQTTGGAAGQLVMTLYKASTTANNVTVTDSSSISNGTGTAVTVDSAGATLSTAYSTTSGGTYTAGCPAGGAFAGSNTVRFFKVLIGSDQYGNSATYASPGLTITMGLSDATHFTLSATSMATTSSPSPFFSVTHNDSATKSITLTVSGPSGAGYTAATCGISS